MKFGLLSYEYGKNRYFTDINFGDEIQSIAASHFLPQIDYFIDREQLSTFRSNSSEKLKVIMNGWYIHDEKQWPPSKDIIPLFTSIHINRSKKSFINKVVSEFKNHIPSWYDQDIYKEWGGIGCRDLSTLEILQENNIPAFFSGCLTLTLPQNPHIKKQDYILCVDAREDVVAALKKNTKKTIISISPEFKYPFFSPLEKFNYALNYLNAYQSAAAIVTTRLHTAMPSLALKTPVLLLDDSNGKEDRFSGLRELIRSTTSDYYIKNLDFFDINNITPNSNAYLKLREKLIAQCEQFTNCKHHYPSVLFKDRSFELQNVLNLSALFNASSRFDSQELLYKYHTKYLICAAIKRKIYKILS